MRAFISLLVALVALLFAAAEARQLPPIYAVSWTGYNKTNFRGKKIRTDGYVNHCYEIRKTMLTDALFSAKVNRGQAKGILMYPKPKCIGRPQFIDHEGYQDMSELPAFYSWQGIQ